MTAWWHTFEFLLAKNIFGYNWSTLRDKELQVRWKGLKCWLRVIPVKHVLYNFRHSNAFPHISAVILYFYMKSVAVFSRDDSTFTYCHNPCSHTSRSAPALLRSGGSRATRWTEQRSDSSTSLKSQIYTLTTLKRCEDSPRRGTRMDYCVTLRHMTQILKTTGTEWWWWELKGQ